MKYALAVLGAVLLAAPAHADFQFQDILSVLGHEPPPVPYVLYRKVVTDPTPAVPVATFDATEGGVYYNGRACQDAATAFSKTERARAEEQMDEDVAYYYCESADE
jgi:hypothetical protein